MNFWDKVLGFNGIANVNTLIVRETPPPAIVKEVLAPAVEKKTITMPVHMPSQRSSVEPIVASFAPMGKLFQLTPQFSIEYLKLIENLCAFNDDFSNGLDNIISLANTEHDIYFDDSVTDEESKVMRLWLAEQEKNWYPFGNGLRGLKADLLTQIVINGALSAEIVATQTLDNIQKIVRIPPKQIRFTYDRENDVYQTWQVTGYAAKPTNGVNGMALLNPVSYNYIAQRRIFETPYAVPPFIAAIESLQTKQGMKQSFASVMKMLGLLGLVSVTVDPPTQLENEDEMDYWARCRLYLDTFVYPQIKANMTDGLVAGFKDAFEFKMEGVQKDIGSAEGLIEIIDTWVFTGLKQDPNMFGRNNATTETFGRVILQKMIAQTTDYQATVDEFFNRLYFIALTLAGFNIRFVQVKSRKAMINDTLKEAQAEQFHIQNVINKVKAGFISPDTGAQELGYEKAEDNQLIFSMDTPVMDNKEVKGDAKNPTNEPKAATKISIRPVAQFDYTVGNCGKVEFDGQTDLHDPATTKFANSYSRELIKLFTKAVDDLSSDVAHKLSKMKSNSTLSDVQHAIWSVIGTKWPSHFSNKVKPIVTDHVADIYDYFRKSKKPFESAKHVRSGKHGFGNSDANVPDAVLAMPDYRTIDYMEQHDMLYLGKFITDDDTKKRIYKYIEEKYINDGLPIGKSRTELNAFQKEFGDTVQLEQWKIRRIIDTSVVKLKSFGNVRYMEQAEVETYEVVEIQDQLTCSYCQHMDGMTFTVSETVKDMDAEIEAGANTKYSSFATTYTITDFRKMSSSDLADAGINKPPFHCHCRGRLIAVI